MKAEYTIEIEEFTITRDERLREIYNYMKARDMFSYIEGEYTEWLSHDDDMKKLSRKFHEFDFNLTIRHKDSRLQTRCFHNGELVGEFDSALLKRYGHLRFHNNKWYAIPVNLLEKFSKLMEKNKWSEYFDEFEVDPLTVRVICH